MNTAKEVTMNSEALKHTYVSARSSYEVAVSQGKLDTAINYLYLCSSLIDQAQRIGVSLGDPPKTVP